MLVTLDEMKTYLGIALVDTTYDSFLTEQLILFSSVIENYCGRKFAQTTYTQTFYRESGERLDELMAYHFPLVSVTSVTDVTNTVVLDPSEYRVNKPFARIKPTQTKTFITEEMNVIYSAGYATIPVEIQTVCKLLVEEKYNKKKSGVALNFGSDVQRISIPGVVGIDFDYTLQSNERKSSFGMLIGNYANVLDFFRSDRRVVGSVEEYYLS
jgi:hypothetical protein